ncbi:MAG: DUF1622 domain-containing protein [Pseudanabaenaceae cyanobacterium SKYGB_i_bin29]|nr:DUF1622 domain-containing protein [Pseudanabaenaceae cyanobacterium SKYG29]MDW8420790.1 DUF1622 domain-containing protein [Pseudanabaenaceae cyanobacterium SKYGB_i_bin29]
MEAVHNLEEGLRVIGAFAKLALEASSVFCIIIGFLITFMGGVRTRKFLNVRLQLGIWMSLALEFQLAADILATTISTDFSDLIKLVVLALVRTFLNFFLQREIREEIEIRQRHLEKIAEVKE